MCLSVFLSTPRSFFFSFSVSESKELPEVVRTVLKQEITRLFGDSNARSFNQAYLTKHSNSIPHRLAGRPNTHTHTCRLQYCGILQTITHTFFLVWLVLQLTLRCDLYILKYVNSH